MVLKSVKNEIRDKLVDTLTRTRYREDIQRVSLFGSYAYGKPRKDSDIDLLIEFTPGATISYFDLSVIQDDFVNAIGREVDLVTPQSISPYFREEVLKKAEVVYEKR